MSSWTGRLNVRFILQPYKRSETKTVSRRNRVCRSIVVSGRRMPSDSQYSGLSPSTSATRHRCLDQAAAVIGRGFAHSDRRPQLKHTFCSMISPVNRSMVVSTRRVPWHFPHRVVCSLCIPQGTRIASCRLLARPPVPTDSTLGLSL